MSSSNINLLSDKREVSFQNKRKVFILRTFAYGFLGFVVFLSLIVFLITLLTPVSSVRSEKNSIIATLVSMEEKTSKLYAVNDRLRNIQQIIKKRKNYSKMLNAILETVPPQARIDNLEVSESDITMTVSSNSLKDIDAFLNSVSALSGKNSYFKNLYIKSLNANKTSRLYTVMVGATLL